MKGNNHGFAHIIVLLLILLCLAGIGAYYFCARNANFVGSTQPTPIPNQTANWKIYSNTQLGFSFKYPQNFDTSCCVAAGPAQQGSSLLISAADPQTVARGDKPFDGFSIYSQNLNGVGLQEYIQKEKKDLIDQYTAFVGNQPTKAGTQSSRTIAGESAISLKGYSWDGIERTYLELPDSVVLIIAKNEEAAGSFDIVFVQILSTFKFID